MELEDYKKEIDELTLKVTTLCLQDSLEIAHELFVHSTSIYINLCHAMGGKKEWKRHFNTIMQQELDGLYEALKGKEVTDYVDSLSNNRAHIKSQKM